MGRGEFNFLRAERLFPILSAAVACFLLGCERPKQVSASLAAYTEWKLYGGDEYRSIYFSYLMQDPKRKRVLQGLDQDELLHKFPHLVDHQSLDPGHSKQEYYEGFMEHHGDKVEAWYWMTDEDDFDWCVIVYKSGELRLKCMKG